jgi:plastocyanin domain-containing protein
MNMIKYLVSFAGFILVAFIYWFFFSKKEDTLEARGIVEIKVSGGYKPENIKLKKGVKTTLVIERTDPNICLEEFILPDFKLKKYLPLDKKVEVTIKPEKTGSFGFHCGMNMYHGRIIVEE